MTSQNDVLARVYALLLTLSNKTADSGMVSGLAESAAVDALVKPDAH